MKKFLTLLLFLSTLFSYAQIGIGTDNPDPSAAVDIVSSNSGMLLPRLKMSERDNIANPAQGLMIYCTDCGSHGQLQLFNGSSWFGLSLTNASSDDMDNDGYTNDLDCDDTNPNINPGATETCNGIDDDCDGGVDNYTTNQTCLAGVGACQTTGHIICENGILVCDAVPNNPTNEICGNGIDDDCDGEIEEGCVEICDNGIDDDGDGNVDENDSDCIDNDNDGYAIDVDCDDNDPNVNPGVTETCNGIDDDCDGGIDNYAINQTCTAGVGACQTTGHIICENGVLVCDAVPNNPTNEICGNGIDDDCDGITDASFTASLSLLSSDTESVSTSSFTNYNDNLLRAYSNSGNKVNGFIKFNLSSLPDNAEINSVSLRLVLMTNNNSPYNSPNLDVYYVETDDWSRANTPANGISLTALLNTNNTSFDATNTYELDLTAWDISSDLTDNVLTLGLTNTKNDYSYVYFHGSDEGTRPVLIVSYTECD